MDNINTHGPGALYETFAPQTTKGLWGRFEFVYTPKHGSWLNMAEIELNVLIKQCLDRRIDTIGEMRTEAAAWENRRNNIKARINWRTGAGPRVAMLTGWRNAKKLSRSEHISVETFLGLSVNGCQRIDITT